MRHGCRIAVHIGNRATDIVANLVGQRALVRVRIPVIERGSWPTRRFFQAIGEGNDGTLNALERLDGVLRKVRLGFGGTILQGGDTRLHILCGFGVQFLGIGDLVGERREERFQLSIISSLGGWS
jgi:hypothetical protein